MLQDERLVAEVFAAVAVHNLPRHSASRRASDLEAKLCGGACLPPTLGVRSGRLKLVVTLLGIVLPNVVEF